MTAAGSDTVTSSPLATSSPLVHGRAAARPAGSEPARAEPVGWRRAGVLLHVTAIPGPDGTGDLGASARGFVEWLARAGQRAWQPLPLHPPAAPGTDPWTLASTFAGDPLLVSLDDLVELGLLPDTLPEIRASVTSLPSAVDALTRTSRWKLPLVRQAAHQLLARRREDALMREYVSFCEREAWWLADHVAATAMREQYPGVARSDWPLEDRVRRLGAHRARSLDIGATHEHPEAVTQFLFDRQLRRLHEHATAHDVWLVADVPAFCGDDSSDVWAQPELFQLDEELRPAAVLGAPPGADDRVGQLWSAPALAWNAHAASEYDWWLRRLRRDAATAHLLRIDRARTIAEYWSVPPRAAYAEQGSWEAGPGTALTDAVQRALSETPVVLDLAGVSTEALTAFADEQRYQVSRVLARGFDEGGASLDLPASWTGGELAYTGDAHTGTVAAWTRSALVAAGTGSDDRLSFALRFTGAREPAELPRAAIETVMASPARIAMVPLGDWLGLEGAEHDTRSRSWVAPAAAFGPQLAQELAGTASRTGRSAGA